MSISSEDFYEKCRQQLASCPEFDSNWALRTFMRSSEELAPFAGELKLSEVSAPVDRITECLVFLQHKRFANGEAVLPRFLTLLSLKHAVGDARRKELADLAKDSECLVGTLTHRATARPSVDSTSSILPAPNPFTDMLVIRDAARFVGREDELRRVRSLLQSGSVTLVGDPKIGKSSLMARLADLWRVQNGGRVFGPLDCQGVLDSDDFFAELAKLIGLPVTDDRRTLRDALRITSGLLLIDEMDCAPGWGLTDNDFALFRAVCSANPGFKLLVVSRTSLKTLFPDARRGSPAYNFLLPYTLDELSDADASALLVHPWEPAAPAFDAATVDTLLALAGTHPFKLQRAAHHRYEVFAHPGYDWQTAYRDEIAQML